MTNLALKILGYKTEELIEDEEKRKKASDLCRLVSKTLIYSVASSSVIGLFIGNEIVDNIIERDYYSTSSLGIVALVGGYLANHLFKKSKQYNHDAYYIKNIDKLKKIPRRLLI